MAEWEFSLLVVFMSAIAVGGGVLFWVTSDEYRIRQVSLLFLHSARALSTNTRPPRFHLTVLSLLLQFQHVALYRSRSGLGTKFGHGGIFRR